MMNNKEIVDNIRSPQNTILDIVDQGTRPADIFSIVLVEPAQVHLHSSIEIDREYLAKIIDVLEFALRQMNETPLARLTYSIEPFSGKL